MKPYSFRNVICAITVLFLAIMACNAPQDSKPTEVAVAVAQTQTSVAVQQFLTSTGAVQKSPVGVTPPPTIVPTTPVVLTPTLTPTITSQPPSPTSVPNCQDKAAAADKTIPDDTVVTPGALLVKTWTVRNTGSCNWTPDYSLVFDSGERMGGASPIPFGQTITPNGSFDVSVNLVAPQSPGTYQGFWKLANPRGDRFGTLWITIVVSNAGTSEGTGNLGDPSWQETFDGSKSPFYLGADSDISFELNDGSLVMTAFSPAGDQWRISQAGYIQDVYLEAQFETGKPCSGKDSYGLLMRAPDQPSGVISSGYVFGFSCDGKYRAYRIDNGQFTSLINWSSNPALKAGPNQVNTMGIRAKGEKFQLYANGVQVAEFTDTVYSTGYFGLVIRSADTSNFQVAVNEIAYWDLP